VSTAIRNDTPPEQLEGRTGDAEKSPWSTVESMLAALIDEVRNIGWAYATVHSENRHIPRPQPIPRPGVKAGPRRRARPIADIKALDPRLRNLSDEDAIAKLRELTGRG
jgi:hypothetical protein